MHSYHTRTPRAAVAASAASDRQTRSSTSPKVSKYRSTRTLWASRPLTVRAGRLVAVRLRKGDLQVALASGDGLRWLRPEAVLTDAQAQRWARNSKFTERP